MVYFKKIIKNCLVCNNEFSFKPSQLQVKGGGKYCSKRCMYNRTKVAKICLTCGDAFSVPPVRKDTAKYCSTQCQYSHQMKHKLNHVVCVNCSKEFVLSPSHGGRSKNSFCSISCNAIFNKNLGDTKKERNVGWKGGITPQHRLLRTSREYKKWRLAVFERDDYACVLCYERGGVLNADHIMAFSKYPDLIFDVNNGRTLCVSCHKKTDNYGYKVL